MISIYIDLIMKRRLTLFLVLVLAVLFVGCAKTNEREVFRFEAHQLELEIGETVELRLIMGSVSEEEEIIYTVTGDDAITLEGNVATAINIGVTKVTAQVKDIPTTKATVEITVVDEKLSGMKINGENSVKVTDSLNLTVEAIPSHLSNEVTWASSNTEIATVENGKVTTYKPGKVIISATSKYDTTITAEKEITVDYLDAENLTVEFTEGNENVVLGSKSVLKAEVFPALANQTIIWTSSDTSIATVVNGVITPVKVTDEEQFVEIVATTEDGSLSESVTVKVVYAAIEKIEVTSDLEVVEVFEEKEITLKATVTPQFANPTLTWTSSDESIATVENGKVTGVKKGTVTIKAIGADGVSYGEIEVTVIGVPDPVAIKVTQNWKDVESEIEFEEETDITLRVSIEPEDAKQEITVTIEGEDIIECNKVGASYRISGLKVGQAKITFASTVNPEISVTIVINIIPLE